MEREGLAGKCPNCGAPIELSPDTVVLICNYCGLATTLEGVQVKPLMIECEDWGAVRTAVDSFVRSRVGDASVREVRAVMVPFWVVEMDVSTRYNGYRREIRTKTTGRRTTTYTVYIPVKGVIREKVAVAVYGRRFESVFGLGLVKNSVLRRRTESQPINPQMLKGWAAIGSELDMKEAVEAAKTRAAEEHRRRVEAMATKVFDCYTEATQSTALLVLYPIVEARYESAGKSYRLSFDGVRGSVKPLMAELPLTMKGRAVRSIAAAAAILAISLATVALQPLIWIEEIPDELKLAIVAGPPVASMIAGAVGAYTASQEQRLMKAGEERDLMVVA
ncbi:hypothetical protein HRbin01_01448 [archaeon HR01]|nr:hypothetical protein HRbin01_01448 [archaeon HR01]